MIDIDTGMFPLSRVMQRRLVAASAAAAVSLFPLTAAAAIGDQVDALWNQPQGVSADSAFFVIQTWWDGVTRAGQNDPTQRGLDELAQANADLLNAYTLLQQLRSGAGPQPVPVVDSLLTSVYNFITGANAKAPVGSLFSWVNQSLLNVEGRGSTDVIVASLLKDYQAKQAAANGDLHLSAGHDFATLWSDNAQRESAFLVKIKSVTTESDGLAAVLNDADQSTTALAAKQHGNADSQGNGTTKANGNEKANGNAGKGPASAPPANGKSKKP
jgi:hypothetical protein